LAVGDEVASALPEIRYLDVAEVRIPRRRSVLESMRHAFQHGRFVAAIE